MLTDLEPGSDPRLAAVFAAAHAPAEPPCPGEEAALAAYRKAEGRSWFTVRLGRRPAQMIAAALFGGFLVAGGVATAATGSLPIPGLHQHHSTDVQAPAAADDGTDGTVAGAQSGDDESSTATELPDTGGPGTPGHPGVLGSVQKGIDTCTAASKGTCQAGQHGKALVAHDQHTPPSLPSAATTHRSSHASDPGAAGLTHAATHRPHLPSAHVSSSLRTTHHKG
jgi:hypothetical protein